MMLSVEVILVIAARLWRMSQPFVRIRIAGCGVTIKQGCIS